MPVAIRAADLNNPPATDEGELIRTISRSKVVPQGLCITNSSGQALVWVAHFSDEHAVGNFLTRGLELYQRNPNGEQKNETERYPTFPVQRVENFREEPRAETASAILLRAQPRTEARTAFIVRVVGRALDQQGNPTNDTLNQEHYVEHKFELFPGFEAQLLQALKSGNRSPFLLPDQLTRQLVQQAFLGQLDLQPLADHMHGTQHDLKTCAMFGELIGSDLLQIDGDTHATMSSPGRFGDGAAYSNDIKLHWTGFAQFAHGRLARLVLLSRGFEKAYWASGPGGESFLRTGVCRLNKDIALRSLTAGHPFSIDCKVVFGLEGTAPTPFQESGNL